VSPLASEHTEEDSGDKETTKPEEVEMESENLGPKVEDASQFIDVKLEEDDGSKTSQDLPPPTCHKCSRCGSEFPSPVALKSHVITAHLNLHKDTKYLEWETLGLAGGGGEKAKPLNGHLECQICQTECQTSKALQEHLLTHLSKNQTQKKFPQKRRRSRDPDKPLETFQCEKCLKVFKRREKLKLHMKVHSGLGKPYSCEICGKRFAWVDNVKKHIDTIHYGQRVLHPCPECDHKSVSKSALAMHINSVHRRVYAYKCQFCGVGIANLSSLQRHERTHTNEKPFPCPECSRSFRSKIELDDHHRDKHTNERPFVCETCGKKFAVRRLWASHTRIHTDVRNYPCTICSYRARTNQALTLHMNSHTGDRPYGCDLCDKAYKTPNAIRVHKKNAHGL